MKAFFCLFSFRRWEFFLVTKPFYPGFHVCLLCLFLYYWLLDFILRYEHEDRKDMQGGIQDADHDGHVETTYSYNTDWFDRLIDSESFDSSMGHHNPEHWPFNSSVSHLLQLAGQRILIDCKSFLSRIFNKFPDSALREQYRLRGKQSGCCSTSWNTFRKKSWRQEKQVLSFFDTTPSFEAWKTHRYL